MRPLVAIMAISGCSLLTSLDSLQGADGGGLDALSGPPPSADAEAEAGDGGPEAETSTYHDMSNPSNWAVYDLTNVSASVPYMGGAAFDGRFVYFAPEDQNDGLAFRYDTHSPFTTSSSWGTCPTPNWPDGTDAGEIVVAAGAVYAAGYVYFCPLIVSCCGSGFINRFDTTQPFVSSSWSSHDLTSTDNRMLGGTFDGRYVYFVPQLSGLLTRYDTTASFDAGTSWQTFNLAAASAGNQFLFSAVYDGRYVYVIPSADITAYSVVVRYDTTASFTTAASYTTFDTTTFNAGAKGFSGSAFDGRFVYLVPGYDGTQDTGLVVRYDTTASFTSVGSWDKFDATVLSPDARDFATANFDGRFIYLIPYEMAMSGVVVRYDTSLPFELASSWQTFDTRTLDPNAAAYSGAAFDGRYLYFEPGGNTIVARFDARNPPAMPPGFSGSFF